MTRKRRKDSSSNSDGSVSSPSTSRGHISHRSHHHDDSTHHRKESTSFKNAESRKGSHRHHHHHHHGKRHHLKDVKEGDGKRSGHERKEKEWLHTRHYGEHRQSRTDDGKRRERNLSTDSIRGEERFVKKRGKKEKIDRKKFPSDSMKLELKDDFGNSSNQPRDNFEKFLNAICDKKKEEPKFEKEKPNFEPSGKLVEDTNTYRGVVIKYNEPPDAHMPKLRWRLYPFKGDEALPVLYIHRQSAYLIGRDRKIADLPVDHPSCSKQHAVFQYRLTAMDLPDGTAVKRVRPYIIDLGSANGTYLNNERIEPQRFVELREKDILKFGYSTREFVLLNEKSHEVDDAQETEKEVEKDVKKEERSPS